MFDDYGSTDGCNVFKLMTNIRGISQYSLESIKEELRIFNQRVSHRVMMNVQDASETENDLIINTLGENSDDPEQKKEVDKLNKECKTYEAKIKDDGQRIEFL